MLPDDPRGVVAARLAQMMDCVSADSNACADRMRRRGVTVGLVTAGVAMPDLAAHSRQNGRMVVGTAATVSRRKGSDIFVAAASAILADRSDVEFRMVGPVAGGKDEPWGREVVARGMRAGIRWSDWADLSSELREWDLFVLPTRQDPFPLVILDAMAAGLPVVASGVDGVCEQVDAASGVLVAPGDVDAIRSAIVRLLDDPARRLEMGRAAAARVAEHFTPERHTREILAAYETARAPVAKPLRPVSAAG
jgi:glycosyltransferase involved in cell wall biosynthesis